MKKAIIIITGAAAIAIATACGTMDEHGLIPHSILTPTPIPTSTSELIWECWMHEPKGEYPGHKDPVWVTCMSSPDQQRKSTLMEREFHQEFIQEVTSR